MFSKILVVGLGSIGSRHLRLLRQLHPAAEIAVLRHQVHSQPIEFADHVFSDQRAALSFRPECAVIANPAPFHVSIASHLVAIGCHVLIEKPLSAHSEGLAELKSLAEARNVVVQVGYNLRFLSSLCRFRQLIVSGEIGRVFSIRCEIGQALPSWRPGTDFRQGVSARKELGGGVLLELSHELDYLRWIFGEIAWVNAWTGQLSGLGLEVEDTAHLILSFEGHHGEAVGVLSMDFARADTTRQCVAIGTAGSLRWNAMTGTVERLVSGDDLWGQVFEQLPARDASYAAQWQDFVATVKVNASPSISIDDGWAVVNLVEAAKASAAQGGARVRVAPVGKRLDDE